MTLTIRALSIMTLSIMKLSIKTLSIIDIASRYIILNVVFLLTC